MLRDFIDKIVSLSSEATIEDVDGVMYSVREHHRIDPPEPQILMLSTLTSFVDAVRGMDNETAVSSEGLYIVVDDFRTVGLKKRRDSVGRIPELVCAQIQPNGFNFNRFMEVPEFLIGLQTQFDVSPERDSLIRLVSSLSHGAVTTAKDDGISQVVNTKVGVTLTDKQRVNNPLDLTPYRTFFEVDQPTSPYVVRMKQSGEEVPKVALFETANEIWKMQAMDKIKHFLQPKFQHLRVFV